MKKHLLVLAAFAVSTSIGCGWADSGADLPGDIPADPASENAADPSTDSAIDPSADPAFDPGLMDVAVDPSVDPVADVPADTAADILPETIDDAPGDLPPDGTILCGIPYPLFPWFDKSCVADSDCAIGLHMVNCCGTMHAIGMNQSQKAVFQEAEAVCEGQYPPCGCASQPTLAEDGNTSGSGEDIAVFCKSGDCMTFIASAGWPYSKIPCGFGFCQPGDESCCVTPSSQSCTKPDACGTSNFAVACDGPEDCGPDAACCMPSGVDFWNFCASGFKCMALELTVCHEDQDCGAGNSCCPAEFKGWSYGSCRVGAVCR
jgi:hypothetical protein